MGEKRESEVDVCGVRAEQDNPTTSPRDLESAEWVGGKEGG